GHQNGSASASPSPPLVAPKQWEGGLEEKAGEGRPSSPQSLNPAACERQAIRFGLAAIKGIGEVAVETLLKARGEGGKFQSLSDMCERIDGRSLNRKVLEALIKSGACDGLGPNRATMFARIEQTLARAASIIADRQRGQSSLFGALEERASR